MPKVTAAVVRDLNGELEYTPDLTAEGYLLRLKTSTEEAIRAYLQDPKGERALDEMRKVAAAAVAAYVRVKG